MKRAIMAFSALAWLAWVFQLPGTPVSVTPAPVQAQDAGDHDHGVHNHDEDDHAGHDHQDSEHPETVGEASRGHSENEGVYAEKEEESDHAGHDHTEVIEAGHDHAEAGEDGHDHGADGGIRDGIIQKAVAGAGVLNLFIHAPGELTLNTDRVAHISPKIPGFVREIRVKMGDAVQAGDVLAVIDSSGLADGKGEYLAAVERLSLAQARYDQEAALRKKKITSEQEYLDAKSVLAEAVIGTRSARQKLMALGFSREYLDKLHQQPESSFIKYEIKAPIDGVIIEKHLVLGENLNEDTTPFTLADMSRLWVDLHIYQKDLSAVKEGLPVIIMADDGRELACELSYISPVIDEESRTVLARAELWNPDRMWRPGVFVSGRIAVDKAPVEILIPKTAVQTLGEETVVFLATEKGYPSQPVVTGRNDAMNIEILSGLRPGQQYVSQGSFELKAKTVMSSMDPHAGHGH